MYQQHEWCLASALHVLSLRTDGADDFLNL